MPRFGWLRALRVLGTCSASLLCAAAGGCQSPSAGGPDAETAGTPSAESGGATTGAGGTTMVSGGAAGDHAVASGGARPTGTGGGGQALGSGGAAGSGGSATASGGEANVGGAATASGGAMQSGAGGSTPTAAALASRCQTGAALCDDFETPSSGALPDATKWNALTSYNGQPSSVNSVVVDGAQRLGGAQSLHVHTETGDPVYIETRSLPGSGNHFFVRAFAYFDVDPGARTKGHWGAIVGVGPKSGSPQDVEVRFGGQFDILVDNYSPNDALQLSSSRDGFYDDGARLPVRQWTCLEVELNGETDELRVFIDGAELDRLHVTDWAQFGRQPVAKWSPTYQRLRIGYQSWNADTPVDVWYDAVAIDTERVGCAH